MTNSPGAWASVFAYFCFLALVAGAALADILLLFTAILACVVIFRRTSLTASLLLVPYLLWVAFAAILNFALWRLNR